MQVNATGLFEIVEQAQTRGLFQRGLVDRSAVVDDVNQVKTSGVFYGSADEGLE